MKENEIERPHQLPRERGKDLEDNKKPVRVLDNRNPDFPSAFDLETFLVDLNLVMNNGDLYKAGIKKYGNYFRVGFAESTHFAESVKLAKAIQITVENSNRAMAITGQSVTLVTIDAFVGQTDVRRTELRFNEDGTYRSGSLTRALPAENGIAVDSNNEIPSSQGGQISDLRSE